MLKIKVDQKKLAGYLNLVKPICGVNKLKISSFRHPFHAREDHDLVKEQILSYGILMNK